MTSSINESSQGPIRQTTWPWSEDLCLAYNDVDLRPSTADDAVQLFAALDSADVWTHVKGRPSSAEQWADVIDHARAVGRWMWTVRLGDEVVGTSSFLDLSVVDARVEIGHTTYAREVWGGRVNPAAKLLLMGWAFDEAQMTRIQLKTDIRNLRSQAAIERIGATREGVLRMYQRRQDDSIRDTVMYSVLMSEWPRVEERLRKRLPPALS